MPANGSQRSASVVSAAARRHRLRSSLTGVDVRSHRMLGR